MRMNIGKVIAILMLISVQTLVAQKDSIRVNDSLNTVLLKDLGKKLAVIDQLRKSDSIKKVDLQIQLNALKSTDNLKKADLQSQLQSLKEKEQKRVILKKNQIDLLRLTAKGFAVKGLLNDTLFVIYSKLGSFSARDRAVAVSNRIKYLADNFYFKPDSLLLTPAETTVDITYGETIIISISESDALWNNTTKVELANKYKKIIGDAVMNYKAATSFATLAREIGLMLLVLFFASLIVIYIRRLFKWSAIKIVALKENFSKGIKIRNYVLFDSERLVKVLISINTVLKWFFILLLIYIALPILFGIFPWTKSFADTLLGYIFNPLKRIGLGLWNYLPSLITIIVIVFIFRYVLRGIKFLKNEIEKENLNLPGFYSDWANPTYQIVRVVIIAFELIVIFPYLPGSDSPVFKGVSVFLGVLFTFGSSGSLSNVVAGLVLTYMRLFKIGDRVKIGEIEGDVIEKTLLVTRIRTIKNEIISIPNSTVMNSHTINFSSDAPEKGLIMHTTVTISYAVPWRDMHLALIDAALKTNYILAEPKPFVLQTSLDDFYVSYQLNAYTKEPNKQADIYSKLHENIQDTCNERGIEILSPHYRAERDGNMTSIPTDYLDKDYKAPTFNVKVSKEE